MLLNEVCSFSLLLQEARLRDNGYFIEKLEMYQFTVTQWITEMMRPLTLACCEQLEILEMEHGDILTLRGNPYVTHNGIPCVCEYCIKCSHT